MYHYRPGESAPSRRANRPTDIGRSGVRFGVSDLRAIITTHTTRHLRPVLLGVLCQQRRPADVVVTCDNSAGEIAELCRAVSREMGETITLVQRPHRGASRSSQVRNNGVRALMARNAASGTLVFLDGDCCPAPDCFGVHERLGGRERLVIGFRVDLTPDQTERFGERALREGRPPVEATGEQIAALRARHSRYARSALLRRFGLTKAHKPKLLSANFSIDADLYLRINGFDEEFVGYGGEDDDLGRRAYRAGGKPVVAIDSAIVYHLWHPTRAAPAWEDSPGIARFKLGLPTRCVHGVDRAFDQDAPVVTRFERGEIAERTVLHDAAAVVGGAAP